MNVQNTFRRRSGSLLNVLYMFNLRPLFEDGSPVDTGRKLNVHKTTRRRPGCLLNVLCTFNLCPVSTGITIRFWSRQIVFPHKTIYAK